MLYSLSDVRVSVAIRYLVTTLGILTLGIIVIGFQVKPAGAATCTDSLQAKIDAAPTGGTVIANPCIYRQQISITKPLTLKGQPGSEIRGSDIWTSWTLTGGYWKSFKTLPSFPQTTVYCMPNTSRCKWPEQVFIGDVALTQVAPGSTLNAGQFYVNSNRQVVMKDDPRGKTVEVTVRRNWITGTTTADNVTIEGFTMKHAANEGRSGALMNRPSRLNSGGDNWTVRNNRLSDAHGGIISLKNAPGGTIQGNDIARGGQIGIFGAADGQIIRDNQIHHNNTEKFAYDSVIGIGETGGAKLTPDIDNTVFTGNHVYANFGIGIHYDIDCTNNTVSYNRVDHNARRGIQIELCDSAKVFGNVVYENGWTTPQGREGTGLEILNSFNTEVYGNTLAWNADGIDVRVVDREDNAWDTCRNVYIHDNTILGKNVSDSTKNHVGLAWVAPTSNPMFGSTSNNRAINNRYWYTTTEGTLTRFEWKGIQYAKLASFNSTAGEEGSRYLTQSEKDAVVANKGIPANPEPH
jgi:parallel beta-helix repeat protein